MGHSPQSDYCIIYRFGKCVWPELLYAPTFMRTGSFYQNYREVRLLVVHCIASRCDRYFSL